MLRFVQVFILIMALLIPNAHSTVYANPAQQTNPIVPTNLGFEQLKISETVLNGPFDTRYYSMILPATWDLKPGAVLQLSLDVMLSGVVTDTVTGTTSSYMGGTLEVEFNRTSIGRIFLNRSGKQTVTLPITPTALISSNIDDSHSLVFLLDAGWTCTLDQQTSVIIEKASFFTFPHTIKPVDLNLNIFPRPIFQKSPIEPDKAVIVVPDQASSAELEAGLIVSAKVGSINSNSINVPLVSEGDLTADQRNTAHIIAVGKAGSFKNLQNARFPYQVANGKFEIPTAQANDGIVQMAVSPWNQLRAVLLVTGNNDAGIVKAAQALSTGNLRSTTNPALSIIASTTSPETLTNTLGFQMSDVMTDGVTLNRTLIDFGYQTRTDNGIGQHSVNFFIDIPTGFEAADSSFLDLLFSHSQLLDYTVSTIKIQVNDNPVTSIQLSDQSAKQGNEQVALTRDVLKTGRNQISIISNLIPNTPCLDPDLAGVWVRISDASKLSLILKPIASKNLVVRTLTTFQEPLTISRTLKSVAFVVNPDDHDSWVNAGRLASFLGDTLDPAFVELRAVFPNEVAPISATHDLVLLGQPSKLPLVQALNATLPAPFAANSDHPTFGNSRVVYRITPDVELGYLMIAPSPWNVQRTVLTVFGNTPQAKGWATEALLNPRIRSRLNGTVAVVRQDQVTVENPTLTNSTSGLGENLSNNNAATGQVRPVPVQPRPTWILYLIAVLLFAMVLILGLVAIQFLRRRRQKV